MAEEDDEKRGEEYAEKGVRLLDEKRYDEAAEQFMEGTKLGNYRAIFYMAICYEHGWGVEKNEKLCVEILEKALEATGDANYKAELAHCYLTGCGVEESFDKFIELETEAADEGLPPAQYTLAMYKLYGFGMEKDVDAALQLLCDAACAGERRAMGEIRTFCENRIPDNCPFDDEKPLPLTEEQVEKAAYGALCLGMERERGYILAMSRSEAKKWFELSASCGNAEAMYELVFIYGQCDDDEWHSMERAIEYLRSSIDRGYPQSYTLLGFFHMNGIGVKRDKKKAREWLERGLAAGDEDAEKYLKELGS